VNTTWPGWVLITPLDRAVPPCAARSLAARGGVPEVGVAKATHPEGCLLLLVHVIITAARLTPRGLNVRRIFAVTHSFHKRSKRAIKWAARRESKAIRMGWDTAPGTSTGTKPSGGSASNVHVLTQYYLDIEFPFSCVPLYFAYFLKQIMPPPPPYYNFLTTL